jgi:hypothetical protein
MYKIIQYKDEEFFEMNKNLLKSMIEHIQTSEKETILERMFPEFYSWTSEYNKIMKDFLERRGICINSSFQINFNVFLIYFQYIICVMNPETIVQQKLEQELINMKSYPRKMRNGKMGAIVWSNKQILTEETKEDILRMKVDLDIDTFYNYIMRINKENIFNMTNIGFYFLNKQQQFCYYIPYCFVLREYTFLTSLGHIGDSSCQGFGGLNFEDTSI